YSTYVLVSWRLRAERSRPPRDPRPSEAAGDATKLSGIPAPSRLPRRSLPVTANQPGTVRFLSPETLHQNPAYSNVVVATGPVTTVYVGGQNALNQAGEIVGKGDFPAQVRQILRNIEACLNAAGAGFEHLVKLTILVAPGQNLAEGFAVFQE